MRYAKVVWGLPVYEVLFCAAAVLKNVLRFMPSILIELWSKENR